MSAHDHTDAVAEAVRREVGYHLRTALATHHALREDPDRRAEAVTTAITAATASILAVVRPDQEALCGTEEPEDAEVDVYPFHMRIKGLPDLFHASCRTHPEFGMCGTEQEAEAAKAAHLATHEEPTR